MMKLMGSLAALAPIILMWAKTSAAQEFLNETPESNYLRSETDAAPMETGDGLELVQVNHQGQSRFYD